MRSFAVGFAMGVMLLQHSATLPAVAAVWAFVACGGVSAIGGIAAGRIRARMPRSPPGLIRNKGAYLSAVMIVSLLIDGAIAGYLGSAWSAQRRLAEVLPDRFEGRDFNLEGRVIGLPVDVGPGVRFEFEIERGVPDDARFPRRVLLTLYRRHDDAVRRGSAADARGQFRPGRDDAAGSEPDIRPMQRWRFTVRLKKPHRLANFHASDGEAALLERSVRATGTVRDRPAPVLLDDAGRPAGAAMLAALHDPPAAIHRVRDRIRRSILAVLGDGAHAGIVVALAVGDQSHISPADQERFARTGTRHLIAVSGLHVSLVAGAMAWLIALTWTRLPVLGARAPIWIATPRVAAIAGALAAFVYAGLAGLGVPALRAFVMCATAAAACVSARRPGASTVLAWALLIVLCVDPWAVLGAGFWLSFGAVGAIALANATRMSVARSCIEDPEHGAHEGLDDAPPSRTRRWAAVFRARAGDATRTQWAVTVALVPGSVCWFFDIPLLGPLANAVAIPWASLLVTPMTLAGVLAPAPLDSWLWQAAHLNLEAMMYVIDWLARPAWAVAWLRAPDPLVLCLAIGGAMLILMPSGWPLRASGWVLWLPLIWPGDDRLPEGAFRLTVLDVGQGTAVLVQTRSHLLVVDTGPRYGEQSDAGRAVLVPALSSLGARRVDRLVVSHADSDHAGGAAALTGTLQVASLRASLPPEDPLWQVVPDASACVAGEHWEWERVRFETLWPDKPDKPYRGIGFRNAASCVIKVTNGVLTALLPGDIEAAQERALVARDPDALRADLLVAPHHGSRTSSTESFLDSVAPRDAVFPVGYANRFGHPAARVAERYRARGVRLHRTDRDGAVRATSASQGFVIERCRTVKHRYWMDDVTDDVIPDDGGRSQ